MANEKPWELNEEAHQTSTHAHIRMGPTSSEDQWGFVVVDGARAQERAQLILTAVNSHAAAIEALRAAEAHLTALCVMLREGDLTRWNSAATVITIQEIRDLLAEMDK